MVGFAGLWGYLVGVAGEWELGHAGRSLANSAAAWVDYGQKRAQLGSVSDP